MAGKLPGGETVEFMEQTADEDEATVLLYVKAGANGLSYGACPFCQSAVMLLLTKAKLTYVSYKIKTVDLRTPADEFKEYSNKVPFLRYGQTINITDMDEFLNFFESIWSSHPIETKKPGAVAIVRDLFSKFCFFIKGVTNSPTALLRELTKIDRFLANVNTPFIDGDELTHVDCLLLPKLQHVRVAAKVYLDFEIPLELTHLWKYIHRGYSAKIFRQACPSDQEIIYFWSEYPSVPRLSPANRKKYSVKGEPMYTMEVPDEVKPAPEDDIKPASSDDQVAAEHEDVKPAENGVNGTADELTVDNLKVSDSASEGTDNPKIPFGSNEAKDEDKDSGNEEHSGNEEQSKEQDSGESDALTSPPSPAKHVTFKQDENDTPEVPVS